MTSTARIVSTPKRSSQVASIFVFLGILLSPFDVPGLDVLASFNTNNGAMPYSELIEGSDGHFYGTTLFGGANDYGTIFRISSSGVFTNMLSFAFTNGANPQAALVEGIDGNFYGTTGVGGKNLSGTVYKFTPSGALTTLISFSHTSTQGHFPMSELILGNDSNFYGTAHDGGGPNSYGTIFKISPTGVLMKLASFSVFDKGIYPRGAVRQDADHNFYGTTEQGGLGSVGTVYRLGTNGLLTTLVSFFGTNGSFPTTALTWGDDDNLYGTTYRGGANDLGTIFRVTTQGAFTTLVSFAQTNGAHPQANLIQAKDGNFYGTTQKGGAHDRGTVYRLTPSGLLTTLLSFNPATGFYPYGALLEGSDGNFYGTTGEGGLGGAGTAFRLFTRLTSLRSGNNIVFSWSTNAVGAILQSAPDLRLSSTWTDLSSSVVVTGNQFTATISMDGNQQFFRLEQ